MAKPTAEAYAEALESRYPGIVEKMRTCSQRDVAKTYGLSSERIRQFRVRLNIPAFKKRHEEEKFEEAKSLIGNMSDQQAAEQLGISPTTVWAWRQKLEVPRFKNPNTDMLKVEAAADRIGKETDYAIAKSLGVHQQLVRRLRKRLGIEAVGYKNNPNGNQRKKKEQN